MEAESGIVIKARIGVHSGPAVGGVIGTTRLAYDYWGDTMNVASRLQAVAPLNGIAVSEATYFQTMAIQDYEEQIGRAERDRRNPGLCGPAWRRRRLKSTKSPIRAISPGSKRL